MFGQRCPPSTGFALALLHSTNPQAAVDRTILEGNSENREEHRRQTLDLSRQFGDNFVAEIESQLHRTSESESVKAPNR